MSLSLTSPPENIDVVSTLFDFQGQLLMALFWLFLWLLRELFSKLSHESVVSRRDGWELT